MLHKYFYARKSNRYNDQFDCDTNYMITWPYAVETIRNMIDNHRDELNIYGYVRCLYLEKPENSNRYWKVVVGIWNNADDYFSCMYPNQVLRIHTDNLSTPVSCKYTGTCTETLPMSAFENFLEADKSTFY